MSHELKTPLTSISGFAELMAQGVVPPEKVREFSGDIYKESQRMIALVDDIMKLSKLDEGGGTPEWETVDLYALSEETMDSLRSIADKQNVSLKLTGEHQQVRGIWQLLSEMVYNLCDNAIKYNRPGGSVTVGPGPLHRQARSPVPPGKGGAGERAGTGHHRDASVPADDGCVTAAIKQRTSGTTHRTGRAFRSFFCSFHGAIAGASSGIPAESTPARSRRAEDPKSPWGSSSGWASPARRVSEAAARAQTCLQ